MDKKNFEFFLLHLFHNAYVYIVCIYENSINYSSHQPKEKHDCCLDISRMSLRKWCTYFLSFSSYIYTHTPAGENVKLNLTR